MRFNQPPNYEPSEEEIAAACAEIQRGWTDHERQRQCVVKSGPVTIPHAHAVCLRGRERVYELD